jgi:hypothetical protein
MATAKVTPLADCAFSLVASLLVDCGDERASRLRDEPDLFISRVLIVPVTEIGLRARGGISTRKATSEKDEQKAQSCVNAC